MSLGIAFKGPEGIVLAADSRVTLMAQLQQPNQPPTLLPATFDNATKLLRVKGQDFVGAVTYGAGAIGTTEPRTAHSYIPELEQELTETNTGRLSTAEFAKRLGSFFAARWQAAMPGLVVPPGQDMFFLVGGYDEGESYGRVYEIAVPNNLTPKEWNAGTFGITWGGQKEFTERLLNGFDSSVPTLAQQFLDLTDAQRDALADDLKGKLGVGIPYQFLPLQDCVDVAIFIIRTTIMLQTWLVGIRGVGGFIDLATITRIDGFRYIQQKSIAGEKGATE